MDIINHFDIFVVSFAIVFLGFSIIYYVRYKRDKDNIPSLRRIEKKIDFFSLDFIRLNNRIQELEDKSGNIEELHKSIIELKNLIQRKRNV